MAIMTPLVTALDIVCTPQWRQHWILLFYGEIIHKRESGGVSTNKEVLGLKRILERMMGKIIILEIVTDALAAVIALVGKMKGNCLTKLFTDVKIC